MTCTFSKCGPKQTKRQLQTFARSLGIVFPDEYRDFLVKHNGGVPKPNKSAMAIVKEKLKYAKFADATYGTRETAKELAQMEEIVALLTPRNGNGRRA